MTVHSFHIFDRRGKTLFTKCYVKKGPPKEGKSLQEEEEQLSEQRKLVFGMLFSLRELSSSLSPSNGPGDLQMVKTGASTLYNYETVSGLRFVLYATADTKLSSGSGTVSSPQSGSGASGEASATTSATSSANADSSLSGNNSFHNSSTHGQTAITNDIRSSLKHIYETIWVTSVIRSPMYRPSASDNGESIKSTNFEAELEGYLKRKSWFR